MDHDFEKTKLVQDELIRNRLEKRLNREVDEELHHLGLLNHLVQEEVGQNSTLEHCDDDDDIICVTLLEVPERKRLAAVDEPNVVIQSKNLEEINKETLKIQNRNLSQSIRTLREQEGILQGKIMQLEIRHMKDENVLNIVNRYWDQLHDEVAIVMRRLDDETVTTGGLEAQRTTSSFVSLVSNLNGAEYQQNLTDRVKWSTSAIAKIIKAVERLHQQRKESITNALNIAGENVPDDVKQTLTELEKENGRLQELINTLHDKYQSSSSEMKELQEKLSTSESIRDDLKMQVSGLEWQILKLTTKYNKVVDYVENLKENYSKLKHKYTNSTMKDNDEVGHGNGQSKLERGKSLSESVDISNLRHELQEWKLTAKNRLDEIENLQRRQREALTEIEKLRLYMNNLPEKIVMETTWYKTLQSKYSVICNQNLELKELLEAKEKAVATLTSDFNATIETMKEQEKKQEEYFRTELQEKDIAILQTRKRLQDTEAEFKKLVASTEDAAEISQEMQNLITSLQPQNQQLENDVRGYLLKYKDLINELTDKLLSSVDLDDSNSNMNSSLVSPPSCPEAPREVDSNNLPSSSKSESAASASCSGQRRILVPKRTISRPKSEGDVIKELTSQLKKFSNEAKELRLLLDMYKCANFETQEKVRIMASERKARDELEETKRALRHTERKLRQRACRKEDLTKRIKPLEEQVTTLQKEITVQRRVNVAFIDEIKLTGEAIDETQEQNVRLIQQLREKDDANFKLIAENIRSSERVTVIGRQIESLQELRENLAMKQVAQNDVEGSLNDQVTTLSTIKNQQNAEVTSYMEATEQFKKGIVESGQTLNELRLKLSHCNSQVEDLKKNVLEKTDALEVEVSMTASLQEELREWRQKAEPNRATGEVDPVLKEMIRRNNEAITCPSCKVNKKDAVLTKCFHVFCYTCLKTRYESRQRKCPKCNATFGANEYHHLYL